MIDAFCILAIVVILLIVVANDGGWNSDSGAS